MVLRNVAKIVLAAGEAVGKAFTRAVKQEMDASKRTAQAAASSSTGSRQHSSAKNETKTNARLGISLQEALQILDVKAPLKTEEVQKKYDHLFKVNDKANGGTLYLQSKVYRAKERIDAELSNETPKEPEELKKE
ncbi:unnamed protein product [Bursaphelenchus xylophilus]|uniref:Mitochondrial import inner membrane translocase subunit tim-16 n=1 Tax=Bursaphelenchus xylophilus TaxID=6326 RepID=A0A1I7STX6_BURXY|nr:unnamed protein product [Bursaphelenchus xylophilus]CAG9107832.1 unnamed protein product [Bursaphelenchus xylophilus]